MVEDTIVLKMGLHITGIERMMSEMVLELLHMKMVRCMRGHGLKASRMVKVNRNEFLNLNFKRCI